MLLESILTSSHGDQALKSSNRLNVSGSAGKWVSTDVYKTITQRSNSLCLYGDSHAALSIRPSAKSNSFIHFLHHSESKPPLASSASESASDQTTLAFARPIEHLFYICLKSPFLFTDSKHFAAAICLDTVPVTDQDPK